MRTLVIGVFSACLVSISAAAEPLSGAEMSLALGGKMLAGDDDKFYRFYANGLLEVTGENDRDLALSFGRWNTDPRYLIMRLPGSENHRFYTMEAQGMADSKDGLEGYEGSLDVLLRPIDGGTLVSGVLDTPQTIRLQRMLEAGSQAAALRPLPGIVNEIKPVLLATDALTAMPDDAETMGAEGAQGAE